MIELKCVILLFSFIPSVLTNNNATPWLASDRMGRRDKEKIMWLSKELVTEARLYMRQLHDVVSEYSPLLAFEVGVIMGKIREKLRLMMETYRQIKDRYSKKNMLYGPGILGMRPMHYILVMENIHTIEVEIDKFVSILENIPLARWDDDPKLASPHVSKSKTKKKKAERQGPEQLTSYENQTRVGNESERQIKSKFREQFLMRRLGKPDNCSTTKKRFVDHWPVEETWSLEQYSLA